MATSALWQGEGGCGDLAAVRVGVQCSFLGKRVVLQEKEWQHILSRHRYFRDPDMEAALMEAIRNPRCITDNALPGVKVAYYGAAPPPYRPTDLVKVAVLVKRRVGIVLTAHHETSVPPKEVVLWGTRP